MAEERASPVAAIGLCLEDARELSGGCTGRKKCNLMTKAIPVGAALCSSARSL
jgi:hypothetical protein